MVIMGLLVNNPQQWITPLLMQLSNRLNNSWPMAIQMHQREMCDRFIYEQPAMSNCFPNDL